MLCVVEDTHDAVSGIKLSKIVELQVDRLDVVCSVAGCRGANHPTNWVSLLVNDFFATRCTFPRKTASSVREGELGDLLQLMVHQKNIVTVGAGAGGSARAGSLCFRIHLIGVI